MTELEQAYEYFKNDAYATEATGIEITAVGDHYAKVELTLDERHYNARGFVMGGVYFTMSDFAFAIASNRNGKSDNLFKRIAFKECSDSNRNAPLTRNIKNGRRTCCYEVMIRDDLGTDVATVTIEGCKV